MDFRISAALASLVLAAVLVPFLREGTVPKAAMTSPAVFAIRDARVFDGDKVWPRATVLVRDGMIEAVGETVAIPNDAGIVDGEGRTLLPGLIDAHVHTWGDARRDALRFGVTTQLDMFSDHRQLQRMRRERESLAAASQADVWSAGTLATVDRGHGTQFGMEIPTLAAPGDARSWVAARRAEGSDFIKLVREDLHVYSSKQRLPTLDAATAAAVIAAAHQIGLAALVHASAQEAARESLRDGADGLVHVFSDAPADAAFVRLARERRAFVVPTLTVTAGFAGERSNLHGDSRLAPSLAPGQKQTLQARMHQGSVQPSLIANARESVRRLHAAGVAILAGSDAPNPNTAHGASLHEELAQLVKAGLEPLSALIAATAAPADAFGLDDRGRIVPGMRADLLLVSGDPTADIEHTRDIVAIWKNGRRIDRDVSSVQVARLEPGRISHFDGDGFDATTFSGWTATTDAMAGGRSTAMLSHIKGGADGSAGALRVRGEVMPGAAYLWSGAMLNLGPERMQPVDASGMQELRFRARGDGRSYSVLLFSDGPMPAVRSFTPGPQWTRQRFALADFARADLSQLRAIAITAGTPAGSFQIDLDDLEIR